MNEQAKAKMRETFASKRARGEATGRVPLGYMVRYDGRTGVGKVVEDPDVMPLVLEARRMREEGHSIRTICRVMVSQGLQARSGRRLSPTVMLRVLRKQCQSTSLPVGLEVPKGICDPQADELD